MNEEYTIHKLLCPKGHEVCHNQEPYFWCETCMTEYDETELQKVPVSAKDRATGYHPTVYGHPN